MPGVISIVETASSTREVGTAGISCKSSRVNTLEKNSFNVSALSSEEVAFDGLVFNLDFAYFQDAFGLLFVILATFCSKSHLNFLVKVRRGVLHCICLSLSYLVCFATYLFHSLAFLVFYTSHIDIYPFSR